MIRRQVKRGLFNAALVALCSLAFAAISFGQPHVNHERGLRSQSYLSSTFDHVNLYNGNLTLTVPIGPTYTVGGNLSYRFLLSYNSTSWNYKTEIQSIPGGGAEMRTQSEPNPKANAGHGWMLSLGALYPPNTGFYNTHETDYLYVAPDGSEHPFLGNKTDDGSYLRLNIAQRKVEFPDGTVHTFSATNYNLTQMEDRFGNKVQVDMSNQWQWSVTDNCNSCPDGTPTRTHLINFELNGTRPRVASVVIAAFNNPVATERTYTLNYGDAPVTMNRYRDDWYRNPPQNTVSDWMLRSVTLPESAGTYQFEYTNFDGSNSYSGNTNPSIITAATLPTGGHYKWDWTPYARPFVRPDDPAQVCRPYCPEGIYPMSVSDGVYRKSIYNRSTDTTPIGTYEYDSRFGSHPPTFEDYRGDAVVTVTSPTRDDTVNYFNNDFSDGAQFPGPEYGLPYTPRQSIDVGGETLYLSQEFYKGRRDTGTKIRSVYVRYEIHAQWQMGAPVNARVATQRIIYHDDTYSGTERYADTFNTEWNGLGKYRKTRTGGNFAGDDLRTTFTDYSMQVPAAGAPWILNLYTHQKVTQESETDGSQQTAHVQFCFDAATGALKQKRTLKEGGDTPTPTNNDIFVVYGRNTDGNVTSEKFYGGDISLNAPIGDVCVAPGAAEFELQHTYTSFGLLATSKYVGLSETQSYFTVNNLTDQYTGLVKQSTDAAGITTTYEYDALARLKKIVPADDARTEYEYIAAAGASNAEVRMARKHTLQGGTVEVLTQSKLFADAFGRVAREEESVPDNGGFLTQRGKEYNAMGWLTSVSEFGTLSEKTTYAVFDPFGRAKQITAPDSEITEMIYTGMSRIERKRDIGTAVDGAGDVTQTRVSVDEEYDRHGRLVTVTEGSGASNERNQTHYLYDVGNRLKQVSFTGSATTPNHRGSHDGQNCNSIYGWAQDANNPSTRLSVSVYDGATGTLIATGTANQFRQDLLNAGIGDGRHGFSIPMPASLKDGINHTLRVKVTGTNFSLVGTPRVFNSTTAGCTTTPNHRGSHDGQNCNSIYGWAQDANNPSTRLSVSVYDDGTGALVATGTANTFRQDLLNAGIGDGRHGFSIPMPASLKDGINHTLRVKVTGTNFSLVGTPRVFNSASHACTASGSEYIWVEDAPPTGATLEGLNESWRWADPSPSPLSGSSAHTSPLYSGIHQHYFYNATQTMAVATGDRLFTYIYLDPVSPPTEVMLQWYEPATGWAHRAYWGANKINWGEDGQNSRRYMGGLPTGGGWVRLEVAAAAVGMEGKTATGMAFALYGGKASWDRAGKYRPSSNIVWVEDAPPTGATLAGVNESWGWDGISLAPLTGTSAHKSPLSPAIHQHYFYNATQTMPVGIGDRLFTYIYLDPVSPPTEIMLQWYEAGSWEHRAYWGANQIGWGEDGKPSRRYMGGLPAAGGWVRLEVPASAVDMEGRTATGMAFVLYGGKAIWDHAGKYRPTVAAAGAAALAEEPSSPPATEESPAMNPIMEEPPPIEESQQVYPVGEEQESLATQDGLETPGGETTQVAAVATTVSDQIRTFNYDNRGFLTSETHPEITGAITYKYNSLGLLAEKVEGNHRLLYAYDKAGRLVSVTDGYTSRVLKSFEYYGTGTLKSLSKLKKAIRTNWVRDPYAAGPNAAEQGINVSEEYSYDEFGGRLSSRTTTLREGGTTPYVFVQTFSYDRLGNVTSQSYPKCTNAPCVNSNAATLRTVTYDYESGYLKKVGVPGNATAYGTLTYFSNRMVNTVVHANGVTDTYAKDPDNMARIRRVTFAKPNVFSWTSSDYEYDGAGNVTEIGTDWYTYDHANRIKEGTAGVDAQSRRYKQAYLYDQMGNMTRRTTTKNGVTEVTDMTVDAATNRLGGITYDAAGNALGFNRNDVYVYDPLNMTKKTPGKTYLYGPTDERVWMIDKGYNDLDTIPNPRPLIVETITLRGLDNEVLREYQLAGANSAGNWSWLRDNIYRGRVMLAAETSSQGRRDYHLDHLGSARYVTNSSGQATEVMWYFPYGMEAQGVSGDRKRFTGHERDTNRLPGQTLYYMHARYYGTDQGKFMSVDPGRDFDKHQPQSWNLYAYTRGNPINRTDPTGRYMVTPYMGQALRQAFVDALENSTIATEAVVRWQYYKQVPYWERGSKSHGKISFQCFKCIYTANVTWAHKQNANFMDKDAIAGIWVLPDTDQMGEAAGTALFMWGAEMLVKGTASGGWATAGALLDLAVPTMKNVWGKGSETWWYRHVTAEREWRSDRQACMSICAENPYGVFRLGSPSVP